MKTLKLGCRGSEVKTLQRKLNLIADGIFGKQTEDAVKEFQKAHSLTADGIVGAATWRAIGIGTSRNIDLIIVHCSATPEGEDYDVRHIRDIHLARGFSDVGYHYIIYRDGTIVKGRDEAVVGAHCQGYNSRSIGVCYIGGCVSRKDPKWQNKPKDTRTPAQKAALIKLLTELRRRYPNATIHGHNEFANKACPSFIARQEYKNI